MKRLLVWDLPVRLFHVLLAVAFAGAFGIAQLVDDDSPLFSAHMLLGLLMAFMVVLRLVWGFVGTRHARFAAFHLRPKALLGYLRDVFRRRGAAQRDEHAGHNPATSLAALAIFAFVIGLAVTGVMLSRGSEAAEDIHELMAYGLLITVLAHVAGVLIHTWRKRDNISRAMIDGKKAVDPGEAIPGARPIAGLALLVLTALVGWRLAAGFDPATRQLTLPLVGETLQLGEAEEDEQAERHDD